MGYSSNYSTGSFSYSENEATSFKVDIANKCMAKFIGDMVGDEANGILRNVTNTVI